ncbi:MAG: DNA-binding protein [Thermoplasmata archaeon]|mgnify:CR=1 FL=1|nr:MAG: DNA-binding protein [Thermoplasmata archaeon]
MCGNEKIKLVLDTSALMSGRIIGSIEDCIIFIPPSVTNEIRKGNLSVKIQYLLESGIIEVKSPSLHSLKVVRDAEKKLKDSLSSTDRDVLALALDIGAIVATDDYSMQNVASELGISYIGVMQENIREKIVWGWRCRGCGRVFDAKHDNCPVCGSALKRYPIYRTFAASSDRSE